jgi:hypothetical protein
MPSVSAHTLGDYRDSIATWQLKYDLTPRTNAQLTRLFFFRSSQLRGQSVPRYHSIVSGGFDVMS